jgi:DNA-binding NarL/FixJ family response regulator
MYALIQVCALADFEKLDLPAGRWKENKMEIRLLIADDHQMMREGLRSLIEGESGMTVIAEADNGVQTVDLANRTNPHVVVMDVAMPDLNGIEATRQIAAANPHIRVAALSGHANKEFVREMLTAGAAAYVLKKRAYEELLRAIREVVKGRKYLSPDIARGVVDDYVELSSSISDNPAFITLTPREREVLQQLAEGRATKEMAYTLGVSVKTVETHRRNIMEKLDLHSVAELTKYAIREGVTSIET